MNRRYRGGTRTQNPDLQIYKSGAETNVKSNVGTGAIQVERENARRSTIAPVAAAQRKPLPVIANPQPITVMSAFSPDGKIKQIKITEAAETPGFGSNVTDTPSYWTQYGGKDASQPLALGQDIDAHSGATISSKALLRAVNSAIEAYNAIP